MQHRRLLKSTLINLSSRLVFLYLLTYLLLVWEFHCTPRMLNITSMVFKIRLLNSIEFQIWVKYYFERWNCYKCVPLNLFVKLIGPCIKGSIHGTTIILDQDFWPSPPKECKRVLYWHYGQDSYIKDFVEDNFVYKSTYKRGAHFT